MISLLSEASEFTAHPVKSAPVNKNELHGQSCTLQAQIINQILLTEVVFVEMEGNGKEVAASVGMELGGGGGTSVQPSITFLGFKFI